MNPTPPPTPLDIVSVAIMLAALFVSRDVADLIGPYAVIVLASLGGASWSAAQLNLATRWSTARHMLLMVGLALIGTVPLSILAHRWFSIEQHWLFAPIAVLIAARPAWVVQQLRELVTAKLQTSRSSTRLPTQGQDTDRGDLR